MLGGYDWVRVGYFLVCFAYAVLTLLSVPIYIGLPAALACLALNGWIIFRQRAEDFFRSRMP